MNIIPTTTGAARTATLALPELAGRLDGIAIRVPVIDGSVTDLTATLDTDVTVEQVNEAFRAAADGVLKSVLDYTEDPFVSTDVIGSSASCTFDAGMTRAIDTRTVKVLGWYDNEWATRSASSTSPASSAGVRGEPAASVVALSSPSGPPPTRWRAGLAPHLAAGYRGPRDGRCPGPR